MKGNPATLNDLLYRIWSGPRWIHYTVAVASTVLAGILRLQIHPWLGDNARYVFFTVPIAVSAFLGGLIPGLVSTTLAFYFGAFVIGSRSSAPPDPLDTFVQVGSFAVTWLILCIVCDLMKNAAIGHRRALRERDSTRRQLDVILDSISDGFVAVDNGWKVTHTNKAFREIVGSDQTGLGSTIWELAAGPRSPFYRSTFETAKKNGESLTIDVPEPNGNKWFHLRAFPNADGMFVYVQDVTSRKHLELDRERILANERRARSDAEEASRLKDEFVATLSHELRSPLTTILGWSELLQRRSGQDDATKEGLVAIERSTRLQAQLIDDLLDMSRIATGKLRIDMQVVGLREILGEVLHAGAPAADNKHIEVVFDHAAAEVSSRGDPARIAQIFSNLFSNAVKFTPREGRIEITLGVESDDAVIRFVDNGEGIDRNLLKAIFDRFRQADASTTRRHGGLGLGLAIVKQLTELHGGTVEADSEGIGKGTTLTVRIPVAPVADDRPSDSDGLARDPRMALVGTRILVVDDDEATRTLLSEVLKEAGATVRTAGSATQAIALLQEYAPDLVLSDIGMPETDGYELIRRIRSLDDEACRNLPAIALTAFARESDRDEVRKAGYDDHLSKPVDTARLVSAITGLLAQGGRSPFRPQSRKAP